MLSIGLRIRSALAARLADIRVSAGYATDMGRRVLDGRAEPSSFDLATGPAVSVRIGTEEMIERSGNQLRLTRETHVIGWSLSGDDMQATAEGLLADIKRAVLHPRADVLTDADGRIGQRIEYVRAEIDTPEAGGDIVIVDATFAVRYFEAYGNPAAAAA